MLSFLAFAVILLLLIIGGAALAYWGCKVFGWGFRRRPFLTLLLSCVVGLLLIGSFQWLFPGCVVMGMMFHGVAGVRCTR